MVDVQNGVVRREDWRNIIGTPVDKRAKKIPLAMIKEKPVDFDYAPAVKPEVHPLKMPASMLPGQVDWKGGRDYYDRRVGRVRLVSPAEIEELLSWGLPKICSRYPRATAHTLTPYLKNICRSRSHRFFRTDNGCGLFEIVQTAWEPQPVVVEKFVVVNQTPGAFDVKSIYTAARDYAEEIKAVEFQYGGSTGVDITPIARRIGYENRRYEFVKRLR